MTPKYEIKTNDSDFRMLVRGKTLEELFRNALCGAASCMKPEAAGAKKREMKEKKNIRVQAVDINSLLVEFLSEVIAETDMSAVVFADVSFSRFGENFLEGKLHGLKLKSVDQSIRAVSFDSVDIRKNPDTGMYEATLTFEV